MANAACDVALPCVRTKDGDPVPGEAQDRQTGRLFARPKRCRERHRHAEPMRILKSQCRRWRAIPNKTANTYVIEIAM